MSFWTEINWTDSAFNTWIGCHKISEACANCYAWTLADVRGFIKGLSKGRHLKVWGQNAPRHFQTDEYWEQPLKWNRRAKAARVNLKVFANDMSDLFEDYSEYPNGVPGVHEEMNRARERLWALIERTPYLEWQLLTKRPENIRRMVPWGAIWPQNVWIGTTVENQARAYERIPHLIELPAVVRFLSIEPMLGSVDLSEWKGLIDWVINGTESVTSKRPIEIEWIRNLRDQCLRDGVAYWFKQWGKHEPATHRRHDPHAGPHDRRQGSLQEVRRARWPDLEPDAGVPLDSRREGEDRMGASRRPSLRERGGRCRGGGAVTSANQPRAYLLLGSNLEHLATFEGATLADIVFRAIPNYVPDHTSSVGYKFIITNLDDDDEPGVLVTYTPVGCGDCPEIEIAATAWFMAKMLGEPEHVALFVHH